MKLYRNIKALLKNIFNSGSLGETTTPHHQLATGAGHILIGLVCILFGDKIGLMWISALIIIIGLGLFKEYNDFNSGKANRKIARIWDWVIDLACYISGILIGWAFISGGFIHLLLAIVLAIIINFGTTLGWMLWNRDSQDL